MEIILWRVRFRFFLLGQGALGGLGFLLRVFRVGRRGELGRQGGGPLIAQPGQELFKGRDRLLFIEPAFKGSQVLPGLGVTRQLTIVGFGGDGFRYRLLPGHEGQLQGDGCPLGYKGHGLPFCAGDIGLPGPGGVRCQGLPVAVGPAGEGVARPVLRHLGYPAFPGRTVGKGAAFHEGQPVLGLRSGIFHGVSHGFPVGVEGQLLVRLCGYKFLAVQRKLSIFQLRFLAVVLCIIPAHKLYSGSGPCVICQRCSFRNVSVGQGQGGQDGMGIPILKVAVIVDFKGDTGLYGRQRLIFGGNTCQRPFPVIARFPLRFLDFFLKRPVDGLQLLFGNAFSLGQALGQKDLVFLSLRSFRFRSQEGDGVGAAVGQAEVFALLSPVLPGQQQFQCPLVVRCFAGCKHCKL